jgi:pimeloyl-ACP methyl ester carboxylesterase
VTGAVVVNGVRLAYDVAGDGEPVLLIGGTGMPGALWQLASAPALVAAGYRVITYDARGVGGSDAPPAPYSVADLAADAAGLLTELDALPAFVIGYSLGGFTAEELARSRPELVRAAVLLASAARPTPWSRRKVAAERDLYRAGPVPPTHTLVETLAMALSPSVLRDDDVTVEGWASFLEAQPPWADPGRIGQFEAAWSWITDDDRMARLAALPVPVLVAAFEHDLFFPPRLGREAAAAMADGSFVELPGAGHGGLFERANEFNRAVLDFFAGLPARATSRDLRTTGS